MARRVMSRPGLPKMSPMNRIFMKGSCGSVVQMRAGSAPHYALLGAYRHSDFSAASFGDPLKDDVQLAIRQRRVRASRVERTGQPNHACKPAESALGQVESGVAMIVAPCGRLLARDHDDAARPADANHVSRY